MTKNKHVSHLTTISLIITIFLIFFITPIILPSWALSGGIPNYPYYFGKSLLFGALIFLVVRNFFSDTSYIRSKKGWLVALIGVQICAFVPTYNYIYNEDTAFYAGITAEQAELNYSSKFNALNTESKNLISLIGLDFRSSSLLTTEGINNLRNHVSQYQVVLINKEKLYTEMLSDMSDNFKSILKKRNLNKFTGSEKDLLKDYNIGCKDGEKSLNKYINIKNAEINSLLEIAHLFQNDNGMVMYQNNTYTFLNPYDEKRFLALINNFTELSKQENQFIGKLNAIQANNQTLIQKWLRNQYQ